MGQYYKFVNTTQQKESTVSLPFNFGLSWGKNLERLSEEELKEKFDYVIENNNWSKDDEVIAIGDYGNILYYPGGKK
jgi:type I restriction-modification system DNA methylase subunit